MAAKKVTIKQLKSTLTDLNELLFEDDGDYFPTTGKEAGLKSSVKEAADMLEAEDTISEDVGEILDLLGVEHPATVEAAEEEEEEETEQEEEEEQEDNTELIATVKKARKIEKVLEIAKEQKIPVPPPYRKDLDKLKVYMEDKLGGEAAPKPEKKKEGPKRTAGYSRASAFAEAIEKAKTVEQLESHSNELYIQNGGKDNIKEARWLSRIGLTILESLDIIEVKDGKIKYNG